MAVWPGFVGGAYQSQGPVFDGERCVNLYLDQIQGTGTTPATLYPCPGFRVFSDLGGNAASSRGLFAQSGRAFAVSGGTLFELFASGASTNRGSVAVDSGMATISSNGLGGNQLFITSGGLGYIYDLMADTLTQVVTGANQGLFINGYFVKLDINRSEIAWSALEDGTTWDPLDVAQRSQASDGWIGMAKRLNEILLLGTETSEWWYTPDDPENPFQPIPNAFIEQGLAATDAVAEIDNQICWLSTSSKAHGRVLRSQGYQPVAISTEPIELAISQFATIADARAIVYQDLAHSFLILGFAEADQTWCCDLTTGLWHQRGEWNGADFSGWRGACHTVAFGKHLVGDGADAGIFEMSSDTADDGNGSGIVRLRQSPVLVNENQRFSIAKLTLDVQAGLGLTTGQGSDPLVMLQLSRDRGQTWGNERWRSAGRIGQYSARVLWNQCGQGRSFTVRIVMSDPIPWRIGNLFYEAA